MPHGMQHSPNRSDLEALNHELMMAGLPFEERQVILSYADEDILRPKTYPRHGGRYVRAA